MLSYWLVTTAGTPSVADLAMPFTAGVANGSPGAFVSVQAGELASPPISTQDCQQRRNGDWVHGFRPISQHSSTADRVR